MSGKSHRIPGPLRGDSSSGPSRGPVGRGRRWTDRLWLGSDFQYVGGIRIDNAEADQARELVDAHRRGKELVDAAIKRLLAAKKKPDLQVLYYFGIRSTDADYSKRIDEVINRFTEIRKGLDEITYEVDQEPTLRDEAKNFVRGLRGDPPFRRNASVRYFTSWTGIGDVHVLWPNFSKQTLNERAETLVHEATHYSLEVSDKSYKHGADFESLPYEDRIANPDTFSNFGLDAYEGRKWGTEPQATVKVGNQPAQDLGATKEDIYITPTKPRRKKRDAAKAVRKKRKKGKK